MQRQIAKSILGIVIGLFLFTGLAASSTPIKQFTLSVDTPALNGATIQGTIVAAESHLPLTSGEVTIDGQTVPIRNGNFVVEDVSSGENVVTIRGPHRKETKATISTKNGENRIKIAVESKFSPSEIDTLARITRAEAEGETMTGQVAVASSILNRVNSDRYPDTIRQVVYQRISGRYQYSPVKDGRINLAPKESHYQAAYKALAGNDPSNGATGFFNPAKTRDTWVRSHPVTTKIGQHTFFSY